MFTDNTSFEGHIHIDIKSSDMLVRFFLETHCQINGFVLVDHNLDLKLDDTLAQIAAEAPIQHYDIKPSLNQCFRTNFSHINILANEVFVFLAGKLGQLSGYVEGEWILFRDYENKKEVFSLESDFFDFIVGNQQIVIETANLYFEFHWTVPLEFVSLNIEVFKKSGLKTVGFEKNGKQYLVVTTLILSWKKGLVLAQKVDNLQYGDWKLEVKKYFSQDMSQCKFLMTTIK